MAYCVITNDKAIFDSSAGIATITVSPTTITGTGLFSINDNAVCIAGDENSISATGTYITSVYTVPGTISAKVSLSSIQYSTILKSKILPVILAIGKFNVTYSVNSPAKNSNNTDTTTSYSGTGYFQTFNTTVSTGNLAASQTRLSFALVTNILTPIAVVSIGVDPLFGETIFGQY